LSDAVSPAEPLLSATRATVSSTPHHQSLPMLLVVAACLRRRLPDASSHLLSIAACSTQVSLFSSPLGAAARLRSRPHSAAARSVQVSLLISDRYSRPPDVSSCAQRRHLTRSPPRHPELPRRAAATCRPWCNLATQQLEEVQVGVLVLHGKNQVFICTSVVSVTKI
jgi:hypothetical protein